MFSLGRWVHFISPPVPRFLTWLTFLIQYQLHGLSPAPYHLFNLLLHALNGVLVFLFLVCVSRTQQAAAPLSFKEERTGALQTSHRSETAPYFSLPLLAALVFAVHPIQTEATLYVYQRSTLLRAHPVRSSGADLTPQGSPVFSSYSSLPSVWPVRSWFSSFP